MSSKEKGKSAGAGRSDPAQLRLKIEEARKLSDPKEKATHLAALGRALLDCDDAREEDLPAAMKALNEAAALGSPHAAYDLGCILLSDVESPEELSAAVAFLDRAAAAGMPEAAALLKQLAEE